jgi:tRNA (cytidine/uridine-2'-O-)-methyltransferase
VHGSGRRNGHFQHNADNSQQKAGAQEACCVGGLKTVVASVMPPEKVEKFNIVLVEPVIPQNTGSIARLCACTGAALHLIEPLGFSVDEKAVKRAGLDYWPHVEIHSYENWDAFAEKQQPENLTFYSKFAKRSYAENRYGQNSYLVFGSETKGLPPFLWERYPEQFFTIPMRTHLVRSLNLAQSAAVVLYEALRQNSFAAITPTSL